MKSFEPFTLRALSASLLLAALALPAADAAAQGPRALVGAWTNATSDSYGANPRSMLIFSESGRYQLSIQRNSLPKFAAGNRTKGTAAEDHAVVEGTINHFGRYTVDHKTHTLVFHIEGSSYPNWIGTRQERPFTIVKGVLTYKVASASGTGQPGEVTWQRIK